MWETKVDSIYHWLKKMENTEWIIHDAHVGKILSFHKIVDLKLKHLNFFLTKSFVYICHHNSGLAFKQKYYYITLQNFMLFIRENSQNLRQKRKWALWMRHLVLMILSYKP
jgi:hypothetical protein